MEVFGGFIEDRTVGSKILVRARCMLDPRLVTRRMGCATLSRWTGRLPDALLATLGGG